MSAIESQKDVVKTLKGTGMFLPLVGRDPKQDRDSRPKQPKKLAAHRPNRPHRNRTASVYMPYHSQGQQLSFQVPSNSRGAAHVATVSVSHQPPRPSSSGFSSCSHGSSGNGYNAAEPPAGHLAWAVGSSAHLSTCQQMVLQQHNSAIAMHAPSQQQQQHALQGVQAPMQGTTWVVSAAASCPSGSTHGPTPPLQMPLSGPGGAPACPPATSTGSFSSSSSGGGYSIWSPLAAGQLPAPFMPAQCGPIGPLASGPQNSSLAVAPVPQLVPSCQGPPACAADLMQQQQPPAAPADHLLMLPASAAQQQQQQAPPTSVELQAGCGLSAPLVYPAGHNIEWLAGPAAQPQHFHQQQQQQQQQQLVKQWGGPVNGTAAIGPNPTGHRLVLGC